MKRFCEGDAGNLAAEAFMILISLQSLSLEQIVQQMLTVCSAQEQMISITIATWILTLVPAWMAIIIGNLRGGASIVSYCAISMHILRLYTGYCFHSIY